MIQGGALMSINQMIPTKLYHSVEGEAFHPRYCRWDLQLLVQESIEWTRVARGEGVDISKELAAIQWCVLDGIDVSQMEGGLSEINLNRQIIVRGMYLGRIIRKVTKERIQRLAREGRAHPNLQDQIGMINRCENWALNHLPKKVNLQSYQEVKSRCEQVMNKVEEMRLYFL